MASRSMWKGFLQFGLVSVPVKAYTAAVTGGGEIRLNQLHRECHSRIQYKKTCPVHGEVPADQIVSGYEFAEGKYVEVEPDELEKMRTARDKAISVDSFVDPAELDSRYFTGKTYYLLPDGPVAQRPYALLQKAMTEEHCCAIGHVVFSNRDQIVAVRPLAGMLAMSMLCYDADLKDLSEFDSEIPRVEVAPSEMKLAKTLIGELSGKLDLSQYSDHYTAQLTRLIEAKVQGKEVVAPPEEAPVTVTNLMEALEKSLAQAKKAATAKPAGAKPPKLAAPSARSGATKETRKRKTS